MAPPEIRHQGVELEEAVRRQLEYYLSQANLANDPYLMLASLTNDLALLATAIAKSTVLELDASQQLVRPRFKKAQRNTLILRDVAKDVDTEAIKAIFAKDPCGDVQDIRSDIGNTFFIQLEDECHALNALDFIRTKMLGGQPVRARIKSESMLKSISTTSPYGMAGVASGPNSSGSGGGLAFNSPSFYPTISPLRHDGAGGAWQGGGGGYGGRNNTYCGVVSDRSQQPRGKGVNNQGLGGAQGQHQAGNNHVSGVHRGGEWGKGADGVGGSSSKSSAGQAGLQAGSGVGQQQQASNKKGKQGAPPGVAASVGKQGGGNNAAANHGNAMSDEVGASKSINRQQQGGSGQAKKKQQQSGSDSSSAGILIKDQNTQPVARPVVNDASAFPSLVGGTIPIGCASAKLQPSAAGSASGSGSAAASQSAQLQPDGVGGGALPAAELQRPPLDPAIASGTWGSGRPSFKDIISKPAAELQRPPLATSSKTASNIVGMYGSTKAAEAAASVESQSAVRSWSSIVALIVPAVAATEKEQPPIIY